MYLFISLLIPFIILFYYRKKYKYSLYMYIILTIIFILYSYLFIDINWKELYEVSAIWIQLLPYLIFWLMLLIISLYFDLFYKKWKKY